MKIKERVTDALRKIGKGLTLVDEDGQPNSQFFPSTVSSGIEKIAGQLWEITTYEKRWMFFPCPDSKNSSNPDRTKVGDLVIKWGEKDPEKIIVVKVYPVFRDSSGNLSLDPPFFEEIKNHPFSPLYYL